MSAPFGPVRGLDFPRVDIHPVLPLLREGDVQGDEVLVVRGKTVADILAQPFLLQPILVEGGHKVCQGSSHPEGNVQLASGEDQSLGMGDGHQAEEPSGLGRAPLARGTVGKGHHDSLQVLAQDLELTHALELHRLSGQVLLRRHGVGEDVQ